MRKLPRICRHYFWQLFGLRDCADVLHVNNILIRGGNQTKLVIQRSSVSSSQQQQLQDGVLPIDCARHGMASHVTDVIKRMKPFHILFKSLWCVPPRWSGAIKINALRCVASDQPPPQHDNNVCALVRSYAGCDTVTSRAADDIRRMWQWSLLAAEYWITIAEGNYHLISTIRRSIALETKK